MSAEVEEAIQAIEAEAKEQGPGQFIVEMCELLGIGARKLCADKDWAALSHLMLSNLRQFREEQFGARFAQALDQTAPGANLRRSHKALLEAIGATSYDEAMALLVKQGRERKDLMDAGVRLTKAQSQADDRIDALEEELRMVRVHWGNGVRATRAKHRKALAKARAR